ncbi:MAG: HU family DNA-binding protein [Acidobacteriota bacterium]|nr:integration host factor subunit beta [Thermoanaerobaculaceae bacterium]
MTKGDLAKRIYQIHGGLTKKQATNLVEKLFDIISTSLKKEGHIVISGFGTFKVVKRKPKLGRIIKEQKVIVIPERNNVVFIPSKTRVRSGK